MVFLLLAVSAALLNDKTSAKVHSGFIATIPNAIGVLIAWMILILEIEPSGFFRHKFWKPIEKLMFCSYLLNPFIIYIGIVSRYEVINFSFYFAVSTNIIETVFIPLFNH
jgi:hypothetical protein